MSLKVPNISIIIGEGGSGGAIALASSNKVIMLENSIYSVISPEGCASILWRDPSKSLQAAEAMKLTAKDLLKLGVIDEVINEPLGGAHRDQATMTLNVRNSILENLKYFDNMSRDEIYDHRKVKFLKIGREGGFAKSVSLGDNSLRYKESFFNKMKRSFAKNEYAYYGLSVFLLILIAVLTVV
tara:strand:- start:173 stop:724 length:552 start_codon:yes stop_codon:yes gene_type:complete